MIIKEMSTELRPRERMIKESVCVLSDSELLAIVLNTGCKDENVIDMSSRLISTYGLEKLAGCSLKELQQIKGIGLAKACTIHSIFELNKRVKVRNCSKIIKSPKDVFDYASPLIGDKDKEHFMVILLDSKNKILKHEIVSVGILNSTIVHPREIFKTAIKESANAIILVHNHPSGDCTPSVEDEEVTQKLKEAGEVVDVKVLDHVIVGDGWESMLQ